MTMASWRAAPLCLATVVALVCSSLLLLVPVAVSAQSFPLTAYPVLPATDGVPIDSTLFPESASSDHLSFCLQPASDDDVRTCTPVARTRSCLNASEITSALSSQPAILASLQARFGINIVVQTLEAPISSTLLEIERIILSEVMGYSTTVRQDQTFGGELPQCLLHEYDLHTLAWKSNVGDTVWNAGLRVTGKGGCVNSGTSGIIGSNVWNADKLTADARVLGGLVPTDYYRAYANLDGIVGLPQLDFATTNSTMTPVKWSWDVFGWVRVSFAEGRNLWLNTSGNPDAATAKSFAAYVYDVFFIPPLCQDSTFPCGIAYGYDFLFSQGWPEQQATNLNWRVAIMFPATEDDYQPLVANRLAANLQTLFMGTRTIPDASANSDLVVKVLLPETNSACLANQAGDYYDSGVGSVDCNFVQESTYKLAYDTLDTDKQDALRLHQTLLIDNALFSDYVKGYYSGQNLAQLACTWLKENPTTWSSWLQVQTPLKHEVQLSSATKSATYALAAIYLLIGIACHVFLFLYRAHPVVRRSSYVFCQLIVLGASLFSIALIVAMQPSTTAVCVTNQFLLSVGFSLFYGSLLVKTWRIDKIFASAKLQKLSLPDSMLMRYLGCYMLVDLLLIVLWAGISAPTPTLTAHSSSAYAFVTECTSSDSDPFRIAVYLLRGIALLLGAAFAVSARGVQDAYNESKFLSFCTYQIVVISAIVVGLELVASNDPQMRAATWIAGVGLAVVLSVGIFIGSKAVIILGKHGATIIAATNDTALKSSGQDKYAKEGHQRGKSDGTVMSNISSGNAKSHHSGGTDPSAGTVVGGVSPSPHPRALSPKSPTLPLASRLQNSSAGISSLPGQLADS